MDFNFDWYWYLLGFFGILFIADGILELIKKEVKGIWWIKVKLAKREENPTRYWFYVLLTLLVGIFLLTLSCLAIIYSD